MHKSDCPPRANNSDHSSHSDDDGDGDGEDDDDDDGDGGCCGHGKDATHPQTTMMICDDR